MKEIINIADLELLTPGSVWTRPDGRSVRYLFTVNKDLPDTVRKQGVPELVVYADESDNYFAVPVEVFLGKRKFFNVDPGLETRLGNLLAFGDAAGSDDVFNLEGDDLVITDDSEDSSEDAIDLMEEVDVEDEDNDAVVNSLPDSPASIVTYVQSTEGSVGVDITVLHANTLSYQQFPQLESNSILHTLVIAKGEGINKASLMRAFSVDNDNPILSKFNVNTPDGVIEVDWDAFVGIYPCVYDGATMYQAMFRTNADFTLNLSDDAGSDDVEIVTDVDASDVVEVAPVEQAPAETPAAETTTLEID